jgi:hypothetical protein
LIVSIADIVLPPDDEVVRPRVIRVMRARASPMLADIAHARSGAQVRWLSHDDAEWRRRGDDLLEREAGPLEQAAEFGGSALRPLPITIMFRSIHLPGSNPGVSGITDSTTIKRPFGVATFLTFFRRPTDSSSDQS